MQLYGVRGWGSAIAEGLLAVAGQSYDFVDVEGFDRPGPARDRLATVNPLVQVPALVLDDGTVMTETAAIALYLSDRAPGLAPAIGTPERSRFYRLLIWLVANVYPTFTYGDYPERWAPSATGSARGGAKPKMTRLRVARSNQVAASVRWSPKHCSTPASQPCARSGWSAVFP